MPKWFLGYLHCCVKSLVPNFIINSGSVLQGKGQNKVTVTPDPASAPCHTFNTITQPCSAKWKNYISSCLLERSSARSKAKNQLANTHHKDEFEEKSINTLKYKTKFGNLMTRNMPLIRKKLPVTKLKRYFYYTLSSNFFGPFCPSFLRFFLCFWFRKKKYNYKYTPKIHLQTASSICYDSKGIKSTLKVYFDFFITIMLYQDCTRDGSIGIIILQWWVKWKKMCIRERMLILGNNYCSKITSATVATN